MEENELEDINISTQSGNSTLTEDEIRDITEAIEAEVWISTVNGVRLNLSIIDKAIILAKGGAPIGWLTDSIIDACMFLLRKQFPSIGGLQSCLLAQRPCFSSPILPMLQIINLDPQGGGSHWVLLSTINCNPGYVEIYDSVHGRRLSLHMEKCLAQLVSPPGSRIHVNYMEGDKQRNDMDCGIISIANMVCILFDKEPLKVTYDTSMTLRKHLLSCLEAGVLSPFPTRRSKRTRVSASGIYFCLSFMLDCTCKGPSRDGKFKFQCTICKKFFHPKCVGYGNMTHLEIHQAAHLPCVLCKTT